MPLTKVSDATFKNARHGDKPSKVADPSGLGLFLAVAAAPSTTKVWRMKYYFAGKENMATFDRYPVPMSWLAAKKAARAARVLLDAGIDPNSKKRADNAVPDGPVVTFKDMMIKWHRKEMSGKPSWSVKHAADIMATFERDVFPKLGHLTMEEANTIPVMRDMVEAIELRPAVDTAHRVRGYCSKVIEFAGSTGHLPENHINAADKVAKSIATVNKGNRPAVTNIKDARVVLKLAEATPADALTRLCMRMLALTSVRPGEATGARITEFEGLDGNNPLWRIPPARMKKKKEHVVPLSRQAVEVVKVARTITGNIDLVFPAKTRNMTLSNNALGYMLLRAKLPIKHVPHGWRSTFSTVMNERNYLQWKIIDLMLAHVKKDDVEGVYNRAELIPVRREIAQWWADALMKGAPPAKALLEGCFARDPNGKRKH
jgi:integrase